MRHTRMLNDDASSLRLRPSEVRQLVQIANEAGDIKCTGDFRTWAQSSVRQFFPHEAMIAGLARREGEHIGVEGLVSADFPLEYIDAVTRRRGRFACPTLEAWFRQGRPQLFDPERNRPLEPAPVAQEFEFYRLKNVAAHGVLSPSRETATYFSFSQVPTRLVARHALMLELLAPHLHRAYLGAAGAVRHESLTCAPLNLTTSEQRVLQQMYIEGSTKTVARALGRSDHTVKHQIRSVLRKLGASNRAEAVTTAIRLGLLPDRRQAINQKWTAVSRLKPR